MIFQQSFLLGQERTLEIEKLSAVIFPEAFAEFANNPLTWTPLDCFVSLNKIVLGVMDGIANSFIDHLLKPGSSMTLIPLINVSLLGLFCVLLYIALQTEIDRIHVLVMGTLGMGLLLSVNW